jgi:hypothetical protein
MTLKYFLTAAIALSSPCTTNTNANQMTHDNSQEAIKIIYKDSFFAQPANRHRRDELIKEILKSQIETEDKIMNAKNQTTK